MGLGLVEGAIARELDGGAVQGIVASLLHGVQEQGVAAVVLQATELGTHTDVSDVTGHEVAGLLHLGDSAALAEQVGVEVSGDLLSGASGDSRRHQTLSPGCRLIGAEQDGRVNDLAEGLLDAGTDLAPDVIVSVVQHGLGDGHDDRDLLGDDGLLVPCLSGGLLLTGVAVHEVGDGQSVQNRETGLGCGHIGQTAAHGEDSGLSDGALDDFRSTVLGDQRLGAGSVNDLSVGLKKLKIKILFHVVVPP